MKTSLIITLLLLGAVLCIFHLIYFLVTSELSNTLFIMPVLSILTGIILNHSS